MLTRRMLKDPEDWVEYTLSLPMDQYVSVMEETLDGLPTENFLDSIELLGDLKDLKAYMPPPSFVRMVQKIRKIAPHLHLDDLEALEDLVVDWQLFQGDDDGLERTLAYYQQSEDKEFFSPWVDVGRHLILYQKVELAERLAHDELEWLQDNDGITISLWAPNDPLASALLFNRWQLLYDALKRGETPDLSEVRALESKLALYNEGLLSDELVGRLTDPLSVHPIIDWTSGESIRNGEMDSLWKFLRYMYDRDHMPFMTACQIFMTYFAVLNSRKMPEDKGDWIFDADDLNHYFEELDNPDPHDLEALIVTVWGIPYVLAFLQEYGWVRAEDVQAMNRLVAEFKATIMAKDPHCLWKYDFVHRWPRCQILDQEQVAEESRIFADSVDHPHPLEESTLALKRKISPEFFSFFRTNRDEWPPKTQGIRNRTPKPQKKPKPKKKPKPRKKRHR